jgi:hypothetical protein
LKKLSAFSWLSFSLPFYSPLELFRLSVSKADGARLHSSCIELQVYLVKWKVISAIENKKMDDQIRSRMQVLIRAFEQFNRPLMVKRDGKHRGATSIGTGFIKFHFRQAIERAFRNHCLNQSGRMF